MLCNIVILHANVNPLFLLLLTKASRYNLFLVYLFLQLL